MPPDPRPRRAANFVPRLATPARADANQPGEGAEAPPARPIRYASVEFNPLPLLFGRVSGQVQVGVYGPASLVVSASRLSLDNTQHWDDYNDGLYGRPSLSGWLFELGPRFFLPLGTPRVYVWLQPSFLADTLEQGPRANCSQPGSTACVTSGPSTSIRRTGVSVDAGFHFRIATSFYATVGLGISQKSKANGFVEENSVTGLLQLYSGDATNGRLLVSLGIGF